jgi:hypothetical protein
MDMNDYHEGASEDRYSHEMSHATRTIIASNEALAEENIRLVDNGMAGLSNDIDSRFVRISYEMREATNGITATFHWGMIQLLASTGRMNDTLTELIMNAKTPAQTAAYEQYEIARDAFRRGLYLECLEALDKAINGDHTSAGYKLEWRFHQMKGTLYLGFTDCDYSFIDLVKAEESFLLAGRYSPIENDKAGGDSLYFVDEAELNKVHRGRKSLLPGFKTGKGNALFTSNAQVLGLLARKLQQEKNETVVAVLFRDTDKTNSAPRNIWQAKVDSIKRGFDWAEFPHGVPMMPLPKSEAWLICALKENPYKGCESLETASGNDNSPKSLKSILEKLVGYDPPAEEQAEWVRTGRVDPERIDMPSFTAFRDGLHGVLEAVTGCSDSHGCI